MAGPLSQKHSTDPLYLVYTATTSGRFSIQDSQCKKKIQIVQINMTHYYSYFFATILYCVACAGTMVRSERKLDHQEQGENFTHWGHVLN